MKIEDRRTRAITPVLAEVILIAITLIAAVAVAGFVYGLFGTYTRAARVTAIGLSCTSPAANQEVCNVALVNNGNAVTSITSSCSLSFGGLGHSGATSFADNIVDVGETQTGACTVSAQAASGTRVTGVIILSDGENAIFTLSAS